MQARALNTGTTIGGILVCIGLAALAASLSINPDPDGGWGARIFPLFGSGALVVLGLAELRSGLTGPADRPEPAPMWRIIGLLLISLVYVWLVGRFGYLISTSIASVLAMMIFGIRNPFGLLAAAIACPAVYHVIFFELLGVFPPYGEWFDLLDVIQGY